MLNQLAAAGLAAMFTVSPVVVPDPNFPNPDETETVGAVVAQLPAPYAGDIEGACAVASIPCETPWVSAGLGYAIENGQLRIRLLEGTQIVNALNVEVVIEIRDDGAAFGFVELIPVCVEVIDGVPGEWRVAGDSASYGWEDQEPGDVISDEYLDMVTTSECDPLLERRDILTIASWANESASFDPSYVPGWTDGNTYTSGAGRVITWEVLSSPAHGGTGAISIRLTKDATGCPGLSPGISTSVQSTTAAVLEQTNSAQASHWGGSGCPNLSTTYNWTLTQPFRNVSVPKDGGGFSNWYPAGSPFDDGLYPDTPLSASSLTAYDAFASIVFAPYSSGAYMGAVDGICDELSECTERCSTDGDPLAILGWVGCAFTPTINVNEWWAAIKLEVVRSSFVGSINTLGTYLFAPMRAIGAAGKTCGTIDVIPPTPGAFEDGFVIDTCDWADRYPTFVALTWALLIAVTFIGGGVAIVRIFEGALGLQDPLIGSPAARDS